jgi:DNA-binding NtrC family response regulator
MVNSRILIVEDESKMSRIMELILSPDRYSVDFAEDGRKALSLLEQYSYDLIITDLKMPNLDGMEMIRTIKKIPLDTPVIVITAFGSVESAVEAMKLGAFDYITKPFEKEMIRIVVSKAIAHSTLRKENAYLREEVLQSCDSPEFVGNSSKMKAVYELAGQVAETASTVLITGESGTGKELLARAIHHGSARANGPFIAVNCASIPDTLLESEFFGFEKGAFTGADKSKRGKFELADGGSLFLDEIAEMSLLIQSKLLRVLQEKSFEKLGGVKTIGVDIRFITATNKNLQKLVERKLFRQDLYYRLNVFPIVLPPLRERKEDIPLLAAHFIAKFSREMGKTIQGISSDAVSILDSYPWPGNVRELQNVIERAIILCRGKELTPSEINLLNTETTGIHDGGLHQRLKTIIPTHGISLEEVEKGLITAALQMSGNNQVKAAGLLKITRNTLRYRMGKFGIL